MSAAQLALQSRPDPTAGHAAADPAAGHAGMRAIVQRRYGTAPEQVMRLEQMARPPVAAGEVLVRVAAPGWTRAPGT